MPGDIDKHKPLANVNTRIYNLSTFHNVIIINKELHMTTTERGFSHIEGLLILVVLVVIGAVGYGVMLHGHTVASVTTPTKTLSTVGSSQNIDNLTTQDASSESSIDSKYSTSDQTTSQSANNAASNVGGAYDESTL